MHKRDQVWESRTRDWAWKCSGNLRGNKNCRWGNWMQLLNGFYRADLSGVQRTPKTSKQQSRQHGNTGEKFLVSSSLHVFLLHSRTELGLEGKGVTDSCQDSSVSPAGSKGRGHHELLPHYCNTQIHGLLLVTQFHCSSAFTQCKGLSSHLPGHELDLTPGPWPLWQVLVPLSTEWKGKRKRSKKSFEETQKITLERMGDRLLVSELQADDSHVFPVD